MTQDYTGPFDGTRLNSQPIEKTNRSYRQDVEVHSIFHTIQGEGPFSGRPAVFIRLAGCNLQCPLCDTEYTLGRRTMTAEEVTTEVSALPIHDNGLVVITGGEPFRQPGGLRALVECLIDKGFYIQIETNGTLPPPDGIGFLLRRTVTSIAGDTRGVYIVCSPKTGKVHQHTEARSCCFKYVLDHENINPDDGLPIRALKHTANPQLARPMKGRDGGWSLPIYVQPADVQDEYQNGLNRAAAVKSCLDFGYTLQLQIHKTLELE